MSSLPTLSVVTPSYNQARYLRDAVASVLQQRDDVHEYFVLDGGSSDGSDQIIRELATQGITWWTSEPDGGQSRAIHKGFSRATGDILFWINSDDVVLPGAFRAVREAFAANPHLQVVTGHSVWIDGDGLITKAYRSRCEDIRWVRRRIYSVCQQTCFFRRELYEDVGGLNVDLHCVMDTDLWFRFHQANAQWGLVPFFLGAFRKHEATKGNTWVEEYSAEGEYLRQKYRHWFQPGRAPWQGMALHWLEGSLSGRFLRNYITTQQLRGRPIADLEQRGLVYTGTGRQPRRPG